MTHAATICLLLAALSLAGAQNAPRPLLELKFEYSLDNTGSLGGQARFEDYAPGEEALFASGPWGGCLDTTAASRHGGTSPDDPPSGSAVAVEAPELDDLGSFTLVCWFRRNPTVSGHIARLFYKPGLLDLMPAPDGFHLGLGDGDRKAWYVLQSPETPAPAGEWRFMALALDAQALQARLFTGTLTGSLLAGPEVKIAAVPEAPAGPLLMGNLLGIRPFNGWLDNVRVYDRALAEGAARALFDADRAAARKPQGASLADFLPRVRDPRRKLFRPSDICFSTRWQKDEALPVMQSFHVTRDLWTYGTKKDYVEKVKALGCTYQGTLNGMWASGEGQPQPHHEGDTTGRAYDLDGMKYVATWMRGWKSKVPRYIGCCNHPDFRRLFFSGADQLLDAGVDSIHVDDWAMNASWCQVAGVCFCPYCRQGFREYLDHHLPPQQLADLGIADITQFDYASYLKNHDGIESADAYRRRFRELPLTPHFIAFQIESLRRFYRDLSAHLDARAGRHVPLSVNHQFGDARRGNQFALPWCADLLDFQCGEKYRTNLESHILACKLADAVGIWQVISPLPRQLAPTYAGLATTYALGHLYLVPWDIYMGTEPNGPPKPRYFATREDFGDYYDLIHAQPELFDGYESPALLGVVVNLDAPVHSETRALCERLVRLGVPFRLVVGAAQYARLPLRAQDLSSFRALIMLSPRESFCAEDQAAIAQALAARRVRVLAPDGKLEDNLLHQGLQALRVEGPRAVLAFPRVKPGDPPSCLIHLVNWDFTPDLAAAEEYASVTVSLQHPELWGPTKSARYYQPGAPGPVELKLEKHPQCLRITVPRLHTWGIIRLE